MKNKLIKATILLSLIAFGSKFLGLARESCLAAFFGATNKTDAFKIAYSIPGIIFMLISSSIAQTFIPIYSDQLKTKDKKKIQYFLNNIITIVSLLTIILIIITFVFSDFLIKMIAPGLSSETLDLSIKLTRILMPLSFFFVLSNLLAGYLQTHERFISPSLTSYAYGFFGIGSMIFFNKYGIYSVAVGSAISFIFMFLILVPSLIMQGFRYRPVLNFKDESLKSLGKLVIPVLIGSMFNQIYMIVDRILASGLDNGSITALDYANRVNTIYYNVVVTSIATVLFPSLASNSDNLLKFSFSIGKALRIISIVSLPVTVLFIILRVPIIQILFERGAFTIDDTLKTSIALACLSIGCIGIAFRELLNYSFYALKDTKTPMINGIIVIFINIILCYILVKKYGIGGLAAGTSITSIISGIIMLGCLYKKVKEINLYWILTGIMKISVASLVMGIICYGTQSILRTKIHLYDSLLYNCANLITTTGIGCVVYFLILMVLGVEEIHEIKSKIIKIITIRKNKILQNKNI